MIKRYVDFLQETTYGWEYEDGSDMSEDATAFLEYVAMLEDVARITGALKAFGKGPFIIEVE